MPSSAWRRRPPPGGVRTDQSGGGGENVTAIRARRLDVEVQVPQYYSLFNDRGRSDFEVA